MFANFMYLMFAHFVLDFSFQSEFMSKFKYKLPFVMFVHVFIWTFGLYAMSDLLSMNVPLFLWPVMFAVHYYTDWFKCSLIEKLESKTLIAQDVKNKMIKKWFHIDQAVHIVQVLLLSLS
jgi:hypothetical protein